MALRPRKPLPADEADKIVEINAQMEGSLSFNDPVNLKINGVFKGNLDVRGTLTIGQKANVEANINGDNIVVAGRVNGDITANKMLVFMPTAVVTGNIASPKLNIVEGAVFQGHCQMKESLLNIDEVSKYLEIDLKEIEDLAMSGKIPATRKGDIWKFEREKIDDWASSTRLK